MAAALDLDVGALPEALDVGLVPLVDAGKALLERAIQGPCRPSADLEGLCLVRVMIAQEFADGERLAGPGRDLEHQRGEIVLAAEVGRERARRLDAMIHAAAKRKVRSLGAEAQERAHVLGAGAGRMEHAADETLSHARIGRRDRQRLAVDQLG